MGFGYRFTKSTAFADAAERYNPKLFASLQSRVSSIELMNPPKVSIEQFSSNFEHMLANVEGSREPMRTDSALPKQDELAHSSAA